MVSIQIWEQMGQNKLREVVLDLDNAQDRRRLMRMIRHAKSQGWDVLI